MEINKNMGGLAIMPEISKQVCQLSYELQQEVLRFAQSLVAHPLKEKGVKGKDLISFAGIMKSEDIHLINKVIEDSCEKIDTNEW
ncbi:MAG: hypothetical protein CVT88_02360 [Candidatus Altiarchaeales archaeon HGW-Altiarchaeales-1]|nr:MAG: hypothetical protein CVT89_06670 [Candidatus Altiarchaeales archaeon HGW-Altiarchaeales-2]PKP60698.1 MAG: hypothetical protein CVT88_02360 [Candidatus Altiarchaeales archaeon HGW-Altiarchaeales-1]